MTSFMDPPQILPSDYPQLSGRLRRAWHSTVKCVVRREKRSEFRLATPSSLDEYEYKANGAILDPWTEETNNNKWEIKNFSFSWEH